MNKFGSLNQQGFTLIELMIVVAIIGILSSIASAAYHDHVARSQVAEALSLTTSLKVSAVEFYNTRGRYPTSNVSVGLASPSSIVGNFVSSVDVYGSPDIIEVTFGGRASDALLGEVLQLSSILGHGGIEKWRCKAPNIRDRYLPSSCR